MSKVSEGGAMDVEDMDGAKAKVLVSSSCTVATLLLPCNVVASCVVVMSVSCIGAMMLLCQLWCVVAMSL